MSSKYTILVKAVLEKADLKKQVEDLQTEINASANNLPKITTGTSGASKNIESMAKGMKNMQMSAVDVSASLVKWSDKLANIRSRNDKLFDSDPEIQEINTGIDSMISGFDETTVSAKAIDREITHLGSSFSTLSNETRNVVHDGDSFQQTMAKNIKKVAQWAIATTALYGSLKQIGEAVQFIKDLNKEMTNIQVVTGQTKQEVDALAKSFNETALAIGATTIEVSQSALEFIRQGKSAEESGTLVRNSMMMSKLANMESSDAANYLTSIMNGYKMTVEETTSAVDKMVAVDNASATSVAELAEALQKTSNIAQMAGVSFDDLVAYIGTVSSVTRKGARVCQLY